MGPFYSLTGASILLATADAHAVYAKVGFEPLTTPEKWMALGDQ